HGLGNDFLVVVDLEDRHRLDPAAVRALCERHRGVGADGVIRVLAGRDGAVATMELRNSDGGEAEVSGNGLCCMAQALLDAELVDRPAFTIATAAGPRRVKVRPAFGPDAVEVSVGMGAVRVEEGEVAGLPGERACLVDAGNPHVVVLFPEVSSLVVSEVGPQIEMSLGGDINVELVAPGQGEGRLELRTWERGAGETLACGTGSCAAAVAARRWGLVGDKVAVANRGGELLVDTGGPEVVLTGGSERVARVSVSLSRLRAS
ncbi:MAG TPA: diaminopimelate epimerase, partial [Acidimicrobiales bacterium]|nr:diaminopimelate epimerase [Acidimicrobiales bacterium]